jgi:pimeloyl-ACP methyl ester carboxylesterase
MSMSVSRLPSHSDACSDGITCTLLAANNLTFQCRLAGPVASARAQVLLLHGFPEWSDMYVPLMRTLGGLGYRSLACNQRGYSPAAAPDDVRSYDYGLLADDAFALAAAGLNLSASRPRFHLVGHDHGAVLGWTMAASARGAALLQSYTALSIPHPAARAERRLRTAGGVAVLHHVRAQQLGLAARRLLVCLARPHRRRERRARGHHVGEVSLESRLPAGAVVAHGAGRKPCAVRATTGYSEAFLGGG